MMGETTRLANARNCKQREKGTNARKRADEIGMQVQLSIEDVKPIVQAVLQELAGETKADLGYLSELEAATLLGVKRHVLRDIRHRGLIGYAQIAGRRIRYRKQDLMDYLARCHVDGTTQKTQQPAVAVAG